ncbi:hypothetical protein, partial [Pengzhenrongella sp.]|jgi:tight adherence protein B|uniref:hypothetical protein n=1 Tax=Pengzhenrongella sp. TaxID=2888820 RepID=UPI002F95268F
MNLPMAVLIALAVLVGCGPGGRRPGVVGLDHARPPGPSRSRVAAGWSRLRRRGAPGGAPDLAVVVIEVASQLRAGADPGRAWSLALGRPVGGGGIPDLADLAAAGTRSQAAAVVAAGKLAGVLGAPLAQVLERVADALASAAEADGERRAALAGPRATARVLTGLPILGAVLGSAVGADPVGVLLGGGIGTFALVVGVVLLLVGRWWIARLVRAASRVGQST